MATPMDTPSYSKKTRKVKKRFWFGICNQADVVEHVSTTDFRKRCFTSKYESENDMSNLRRNHSSFTTGSINTSVVAKSTNKR